MKKLLLILILQNFATGKIQSQSFNVEDLVTLTSLPSKNIDRFMNKNGFILSSTQLDGDKTGARFIVKTKAKRKDKDIVPKNCVDIYAGNHSKYFSYQTFSLNEYLDGQKRLIKEGFFYDRNKDFTKEASMLYQKRNISIVAITGIKDEVPEYTFILEEKEIADISDIKYAENLLQFTSHEFLSSYFGAQNVKKDLYFFSEKELKKCSVLFSGTRRQAVFVWGDESNLNELAYILVSNVIPTAGAEQYKGVIGNNEWKFQNGIHPGMALKDLLRLNEMDFEIYGNKSELAFMIKPEKSGKIDFTKTAILLNCNNCNNNTMFNHKSVSALDAAKQNLPLYVYDVILYPSPR
ncbi:MAG: hypothetical protein ABIO81_02430 [Ginsengibacter sp.]